MKQSFSKYYLLMLVVVFCIITPELSGQTPFDPALSLQASQITERVELFTDRSIYAVEEPIHFRADHFVAGVDDKKPWSTVLYVELVSYSGEAVAKGKFRILEGVSRGLLPIPPETLSGNYFLKCYTRWMRNAGPGTFSYIPLKIINPFRSEVSNHTNGTNLHHQVSRVKYHQGNLVCTTATNTFGRGEEVRLQLNIPAHSHFEELQCCLTTVPAGGIDTLYGSFNLPENPLNQEGFQVGYLPDLGSGTSLSGSVVHSDYSPAKYTTLHFALLGEKPDFFAAITDINGRFALSTTARTGVQELFVSPDPAAGEFLEVQIDQDFDSRPLPVSIEKFSLSEEEKEVATKIALQMQLNKPFGNQVKPGNVTQDSVAQVPFYGTGVQTVYMKDFVNLPTLEEVFINLVPNVDVVKRRGRAELKIQSNNSGIGVYPPLIMIDHITVFDQEALLSLEPEKIDRIDLINEVYLKGNVAFGGLISIYSRKGDMAGIDLPSGSYFFDFQSLHPDAQVDEPVIASGDRIPDSRNTILWMDDVLVEKGIANEILFTAPSSRGEYWILLRGVSPQGELTSVTHRFTVR